MHENGEQMHRKAADFNKLGRFQKVTCRTCQINTQKKKATK